MLCKSQIGLALGVAQHLQQQDFTVYSPIATVEKCVGSYAWVEGGGEIMYRSHHICIARAEDWQINVKLEGRKKDQKRYKSSIALAVAVAAPIYATEFLFRRARVNPTAL